jgi:Pilus formation protein N terminal region
MTHRWLLAIVLSVVALGPVSAEPVQQPPAERLELKPGFSTLIQFNEPVRTLAIGNPDIADITPQSDRTFVLRAIRVGETNLIAINEAGRSIFRATLLVGGGEIGRLTVHSRRALHEYWTYRCSEFSCTRFDDRFERTPTPPVYVVPRSGPPGNGEQIAAPDVD